MSEFRYNVGWLYSRAVYSRVRAFLERRGLGEDALPFIEKELCLRAEREAAGEPVDERKRLERKLYFLQRKGKAGGVAWRKAQRKLRKLK